MYHPPPPPSTFASVSLNRTDKLRLLQFPPSITHDIADQLRASWPPGIQAEKTLPLAGGSGQQDYCYEYKLKGTPFEPLGTKEGVHGRRLIRDVLGFLYARGWTLVTPVSHSRYPRSKDSLVFRQARRVVSGAAWEEEGKGKGKEVYDGGGGAERYENEKEMIVMPPPVEWLIIAPARGDRLRVICDGPHTLVNNSSSSTSTSTSRKWEHSHTNELGVLIQALKQEVVRLEYFQSGEWSHDSFEFKLKGYPWSATGEETVKVERLLLAVFETLDRFGWRAYASVRLRSDGDDVRKSETVFFVRG